MGKILVVDDEPDILASMADLLHALGHETLCASDADEALVKAAIERPDVILHDLRMPNLSLAGMVASLRSHPDTAHIPLVFFSAHPDLPRTAAKYDAWGYLRKPFAEPELIAMLDGAIGGRPPGHSNDMDFHRTVQDLFHDFWNTLSAMAITTRTLVRSDTVRGDDRRVAEALDDLLLKLESKTDRLRASVVAMMDDLGEQAPRGAKARPPPV